MPDVKSGASVCSLWKKGTIDLFIYFMRMANRLQQLMTEGFDFMTIQVDVAILGGGPGGYTAAI